MLASISWSVDQALSLRRLIAYACLMISALGTAAIAFERLPAFIVTFCSLNFFAGIIAEIVLGTFNPGTVGYRFGGTLHPNLQGVNLALLILSCFWLQWSNGGKRQWLSVSGILIATFFLLLTQSRTALGAVILAFIFSLSIQLVRKRGLRSLSPFFSAFTLLISLVLTLSLIIPDISLVNIAQKAITRERDEGDPMALTGRAYLWPVVLEYAADRPILGYGHDAFWSSERIKEISMRQNWAINQAHSGYLEMLVNLGIVGLLIYLFIIIYGTMTCIRFFLRGNNAYGIGSALMVFGLIHTSLESISVLPIFSHFLIFTVLFHKGFFGNPHPSK